MENAELVRAFRQTHDMIDIYIKGIDKEAHQLIDADGRRFEEIETNIWGETGIAREILYLGTGRHGGGVMLRPLFLRTSGGTWLNSTTGKVAPFDDCRKAIW